MQIQTVQFSFLSMPTTIALRRSGRSCFNERRGPAPGLLLASCLRNMSSRTGSLLLRIRFVVDEVLQRTLRES